MTNTNTLTQSLLSIVASFKLLLNFWKYKGLIDLLAKLRV